MVSVNTTCCYSTRWKLQAWLGQLWISTYQPTFQYTFIFHIKWWCAAGLLIKLSSMLDICLLCCYNFDCHAIICVGQFLNFLSCEISELLAKRNLLIVRLTSAFFGTSLPMFSNELWTNRRRTCKEASIVLLQQLLNNKRIFLLLNLL